MTLMTVTAANFERIIGSSEIVLLGFWASSCDSCRTFAPAFERAAAAHLDVAFGKVDTEAEPELAARFDIESVPTLMVIRDNVVLYAQPGALSGADIDSLIREARAIDASALRRNRSAVAP